MTNAEGEGNCSKNSTREKECRSTGKYRFLKTKDIDNKHINLWSFVMIRFMGKNWYKICQCEMLN